MAYILQTNKSDTLNGSISSGATSATLTSGNFGSPSGTQLYVIDYDNANLEVVSATVVGTAMSSITRNLDGTSAVAHASGAKVLCALVPSHYAALLAGSAGFNFDKVRVVNSTDQTIANNTDVTLTFDGELFDTNGLHSTVTNTSRLTAQVAGKYLIVGQARWDANATGVRDHVIVLNGATSVGEQQLANAGGTERIIGNVTGIYAMAVTDYVELHVSQTSGGSLAVKAAGTHFSMTLLP